MSEPQQSFSPGDVVWIRVATVIKPVLALVVAGPQPCLMSQVQWKTRSYRWPLEREVLAVAVNQPTRQILGDCLDTTHADAFTTAMIAANG